MRSSINQDQMYVTVDMLILTVRAGQLNLLLRRRAEPPHEGKWALPGRFISPDESAETSANRLLEEMLPIRDTFLEQLYTFTDVNRDARGRVISIAYLVIVSQSGLAKLIAEKQPPFYRFRIALDEGGLRLTGEDEEELRPGDLAFDHGQIIETGVRRLRGKIDYTDIGFRFLEDANTFSLGELQAVYEAILGEKLDNSNFRRAIMNRYEKTGRLKQTDQTGKQGRGRPAALYRMTL